MPVVKEKQPEVVSRKTILSRAVGKADDFYVLATSGALDEAEREINPDHTRFTWILHYQQAKKTIVERVNEVLYGLWQPAQGPILAVGGPRGVLEVDAAGVKEVALTPPPPPLFRSVWGLDPGSVFACGGVEAPFVVHRRAGQWTSLPVPPGVVQPSDIRGFSDREVYVTCQDGKILLWDGKAFSTLAVPTTRPLFSLARLGGGMMCASGGDGTLVVGNAKGWRIVATHTEDELWALAEWDGKVFYAADDEIWSFDGKSPPAVAISEPAVWISGLADGLVFDDGEQARLYHGGKLVTLDTNV